jgi:threonine dehydratase
VTPPGPARSDPPAPTLADVRAAAERIAPHAHRTPVATCATLDALAAAELFFKCENLQRVGAFKFRGATNAVFGLDDKTARRGVATHSSGNHAQALALAARRRGIAAHIVMPENAPAVKRAAVAGYGARIYPCAPTLAAREAGLAEVVAATGAHVVHPYDDPRVIAGQGTAALELLEDVPDLDAIVTPVGGGGLLAGTAVAATALRPGIAVLAAEPDGAADAHRSLAAERIQPSERPRTICDGLLTSLGVHNFPIIRRHVAAIVTVPDAATIAAMRLIWERMKLVVEPSAAIVLAAVLEQRGAFPGRRLGLILSGGNVDLERLPWGPA